MRMGFCLSPLATYASRFTIENDAMRSALCAMRGSVCLAPCALRLTIKEVRGDGISEKQNKCKKLKMFPDAQ
jgi:hypothetical protein